MNQKVPRKNKMAVSVQMPRNINVELVSLDGFETYDRFHWIATITLSLSMLFGSDYLAKQTLSSGLSGSVFACMAIWSIYKLSKSKKHLTQSIISKKFQI